jgi:hypothetical protein
MKDKMPELPLKIGMTGMLRGGVEFTIIGFLEYCYSEVGEEEEYWIGYQLYSPTHDYIWLTWEYATPQRYQLSRRVRSWTPNYSRTKSSYTAEVSFVAGELTWIAKLGDKVTMGQTYEPNISFEKSKDEVEYYFNQYLNADSVHRSFGAEPIEPPEKVINGNDKPKVGCFNIILFLIIIIFIIAFVFADDDDGGFYYGGSRSSGSFSSFGK